MINASGLVQKRFDQSDDYRKLVGLVLRLGLDVVLVPHVTYAGHSDLPVMRRLAEQRGDGGGRLHVAPARLSTLEIPLLARRASVVVTGRMHLGIQALNFSTPALIVDTQGKVEGLCELFGLHEMRIPAHPGFSQIAAERIREILDDPELWRSPMDERLPRVRALSALNFADELLGAGWLMNREEP